MVVMILIIMIEVDCYVSHTLKCVKHCGNFCCRVSLLSLCLNLLYVL